jgi:hypothetical protein
MDNYPVLFHVAEVIESKSNTYKYIGDGPDKTSDKLFTITVQIVNRVTKEYESYACKPFNMNIKQIPLIGEHVLIFKAYNQETTLTKTGIEWYYFSPYSIQSSINSNLIPGISYNTISEAEAQKIKPGVNFEAKSISPLQPYEGDLMIEGRWGNTLRFGSTTKNETGLINSSWHGAASTIGDPIIILSNGQINKPNKQFVVENIQTDNASIYLTSTQKIKQFKLNNKLKIGSSESAFSKPQLIGAADRIILTAKTDIVAIDSQKGIELHAPKINIGISDEKEPLLHSTATIELLKKLIQICQIGFVDSNGSVSTPIYNALSDSGRLLLEIANYNIMIDKYKK